MSDTLDLKQIERKAFRSTYQDGLWDIYMGVIVAGMAIFVYRPASSYSAINVVAFVLTFAIGNSLFWLGKKFITLPRMGQVRFGPMRQQKIRVLAIILGIVVLIQVGLVWITGAGGLNQVFGRELVSDVDNGRLTVATVCMFFVGIPMLFIAYLNDFMRGYYIAILISLAVFLMIYTNQPIYPLIISGFILIPGILLFIRFLRMYPIPLGDGTNG